MNCFIPSPFSVNQKLTLAHQQMTADYEKMRQEEADISAKLQERMSVDKSERFREIDGNLLRVVNGRGGNKQWSELGTEKQQERDKSEQCWGVICDKGIVTECDKRRLFGVIMNAKRRKEMLNLSEMHLKQIEGNNREEQKSEKENRNLRRRMNEKEIAKKKRNFKGLVREVLEQLPFALPTLQLHIILSLTMVLLTHQCPVASYFIAV